MNTRPLPACLIPGLKTICATVQVTDDGPRYQAHLTDGVLRLIVEPDDPHNCRTFQLDSGSHEGGWFVDRPDLVSEAERIIAIVFGWPEPDGDDLMAIADAVQKVA